LAEFVEDLCGDRILISPGRAARPYDFRSTPEERLARCPFCPGHEAQTPPEAFAVREGGGPDSPGWQLRVTPNLYPAVPREPSGGGAFGIHEVIIETPRHDARLGDLSQEVLFVVLSAWRGRFLEAQRDERLRYGLIFKNQGPNAGASLEHPHSQFIALPFVPERVQASLRAFAGSEYRAQVECELESLDHLVVTSRRLAAISPRASRFSYELWLLPKTSESRFEECDDGLLEEAAGLLGRLLGALDRVLDRPDYHLLVHTAPFGEERYWWHIQLFPRLNRVAGFEWATGVFLNQVAVKEATHAWRQALGG
jgi:UDPglucose--hexose-1-phosphate uridylyltransferase